VSSWLEVEAEERFDVVLSDLRGRLPLFGTHLASLHDAKTRLLSADGTLVPRMDRIRVAPITNQEGHDRIRESYGGSGLDLSLHRRMDLNVQHQLKVGLDVTHEALLASPAEAFELIYGESPPEFFATDIQFQPTRSGMCHGFAVWFDAELAPGISFTSGLTPNLPCANAYNVMWLPLEVPLPLTPGQPLSLRLIARAAGADYVWAWSGGVEGRGVEGRGVEGKGVEGAGLDGGRRASFSQSTFLAEATVPRIPSESLRPGTEGLALAKALQCLQQGQTLSQVAAGLDAEFASHFSRRGGALRWLDATVPRFAERSRE